MAATASRRVRTRFTLLGGVLALIVILIGLALGGTLSSAGHPSGGGTLPSNASRASQSGASQAGGSERSAHARSPQATSVPARASGGASPASRSGSPASRSGSPASRSGATVTKAGGGATSTASKGAIAEVRDPEEARSYPAPPSVHHKPAKTPATAGQAIVAPGAASDAEVREELAKMHEVERASSSVKTMQTVPGGSSIAGSGKIPIPTDVPVAVQRVIAGANAIADFPYVYGGGHASFVDSAYDCSGSVSYALAAGGMLSAPETSGQLESWGKPGPGRWITVYANAGHTYMYVNIGGAWMLYDTAGRSGVFSSRWQPYPVDNSGYVARHWPGL